MDGWSLDEQLEDGWMDGWMDGHWVSEFYFILSLSQYKTQKQNKIVVLVICAH
jgi:hypothetical protein